MTAQDRSQGPCDLWRRSVAARLLGLRGTFPPGKWMSVCCECWVLSSRRVCDGTIPRPEESYLMVCLSVTVQQDNGEALANYGLSHHEKIIIAQVKQ